MLSIAMILLIIPGRHFRLFWIPIDDYIYAISESKPLQRYSLAKNNWQSGANLSIFKKSDRKDALFTVEAVVFKSKLFTIHGYK